MRTRAFRSLGLLVGSMLTLFVGLPARATPITNGDFETGGFDGWTLSGAGVVVSFDVDGDSQASLAARFTATSPSYSLQQNFLISQAGSLQISANIAVSTANPDAQGGQFRLLIDGNPSSLYDFGAVSAGVHRNALLFNVGGFSAGAHTLRIEISRPGAVFPGPIQYIDDIVFSGTAVVPEPATGVLMGIGLACLATSRKRS